MEIHTGWIGISDPGPVGLKFFIIYLILFPFSAFKMQEWCYYTFKYMEE